jgi:NNP family nitrate/nitrite transporter-like MFS transporter
MLLKSQSAVAEKAAIAENVGKSEAVINAAQSLASSTAVSGGYFIIGIVVIITALVSLSIRFSAEDEAVAKADLNIDSENPKLAPLK